MAISLLPSETDVLIVGAGPAGLSAALSVAINSPDLHITIVDALPTGQNDSRAITLHPRTMESLRKLNVTDDVLQEGILTQGVNLFSGEKLLLRTEYNQLSGDTSYPFLTLLSQATTESILNKRLESLGVQVLRPYRLVNIEDADDGVLAKFEGGQRIRASYIVGADGSRSIVRELAGITFHDVDFFGNPKGVLAQEALDHTDQPHLALADIKFESSPFIRNLNQEMSLDFSEDGFFALAPLTKPRAGSDNSDVLYRVLFEIPKGCEARARDVSDGDFLQEQITRGLAFLYKTKSDAPTIREVTWQSIFRVRFAVASTAHKHLPRGDGNILLVGDASHVHSPAGGQGMNLGIRDGIDAGESIAAHAFAKISSYSDLTPLILFAERRHRLAVRIIRMTKLTNWIWTVRSPVGQFLRDLLMNTLDKLPGMRRWVAWRLSGLQYSQ